MSPAERFVAFCRRRPMAVDTALAVVLLLIAVLWTDEGKVPAAQQTAAFVIAVFATAPVVWRRRFPVPAAAVTAVVAAVCEVAFVGTSAVFLLPALVMGYSAVAYGPRWAGPLTAVVLLIGIIGIPLSFLGGTPDFVVVASAVFFGVAIAAIVWLLGALRRAQFRYTEQLSERARLLEQGRRQEVRLELLAERSRISREVHDVVAHSLSGIIAQADGGSFAAQRDPARAVEVLAGIASAGREALGDVRGLLELLRDAGPEQDPTDGDPAGRPQPGTDDVAALVEQVRAGGLPVDLRVTGTARPIGTGAGLAAYRAVQESLTNVIKHAGPSTPTHVDLDWGRDELVVRVRDEGARGPRPTPPRGGHGLVGMRERAALHGGSADTGPHPDGGFAVRVRLPIPPSPTETVRTP